MADAPAPRSAPRERVCRIGHDGGLVGIVTEAATGVGQEARPGVVFINAGVVHRVGPNRLYVNLARHLAQGGFTCMRFDLSGIGDSLHRSDDLPAEESAVLETQAAMHALQQTHGLRSFVLIGLCSGAVTSFHAALRDDRVTGAVLLNPQGFHHDPAWNAHVLSRTEARRYVTNAMNDASRWRRALTGRISYRRLARVLTERLTAWTKRATAVSPVAGELAAEFQRLAKRGVRLLVVCSDGDASVDYMAAILGDEVQHAQHGRTLQVRVFPKTDHSLTLGTSQRALFGLIDEWARGAVA